MQVRVFLFAAAAQKTGTREVTLTVSDQPNLAEIADELARVHPPLQSLIAISRWAVDQEFVPLSTAIVDQSEIALIPPVSGG